MLLDWNFRTNTLPFVGDFEFESGSLRSYGINRPSAGTMMSSSSGPLREAGRGRQQKCMSSSSSKR